MIMPASFHYIDADPTQPGASLMPLLPLTLEPIPLGRVLKIPVWARQASCGRECKAYWDRLLAQETQEVRLSGLLDTGAATNVLPYSIGKRLGFVWEQQRVSLVLSGNLARIPARGIVVSATVASFAPVRLAFAWAQSDDVRLLLGQANFFHEFDVCFFRSRSEFDIRPKSAG